MRRFAVVLALVLALPLFALASVVMVIGLSLRAIVEVWQR